jgi:hypothetical protein
MNQIKKRLSIIKLAISMTDKETIQLQILKLTPIKTDKEIQDILTLLQAGNYAQAQAYITKYIDFAPQEVVQRTSQSSAYDNLFTLPEEEEDEDYIISAEEQAIIDEFQLIVNKKEPHMEIDINNFMPLKKTKVDQSTFEEQLHTINLDTPAIKDSFFDTTREEPLSYIEPIEAHKEDTFFNVFKHTDDANQEEAMTEPISNEILNEPSEVLKESHSDTVLGYPAIENITTKYIAMKAKYPLIQKIHSSHGTVDALLSKIAKDGYTELEIEEMLAYIKKLIIKKQYTEAAQLLLVSAATESKFALFMLARELYKGSVLRKNTHESFALMNALAIDDYPEALCDLGQFYEHGIGTTPNPIKAEGLYKEAAALGIKRAKKHYARLKKDNKGFFRKSSSL